MTYFKYFSITALVVFLISCSDSGTNSQGTLARFIMKFDAPGLAKNNAGSVQLTDVGGTTFTINEAYINVRHIQFDLPESSIDSTNQVSLDGPFIVDLMEGSSTPDIDAFAIEPGNYKRIDIRLDDTKEVDGLIHSTDPLMDNTIILKGIFNYDGISGRNFSLILKFNEDVRFEEPAGITVEEGESNKVILNLNVTEWLENIDITECLDDGNIVLEGNGDLIINEENGNADCNNMEQIIKTNIKNKYDFN